MRSAMEKNMCTECEKWKEKQAEVLMYCATVFDVDLDMRVFETECKKTCPFGNNS
jgi:hypothetical protein